MKLERGGTSARRAAAIVDAGIPVMGHVGLTPQTATALGGYRAQGRQGGQAAAIVTQALELQAAGCFAVVAEAVPAPSPPTCKTPSTCPSSASAPALTWPGRYSCSTTWPA